MTEKAKAFLNKASEDEVLQKKLVELCQETDENKAKAELISLAQQAGITLAAEDFEQKQGDLDDEELAAVVGGYQQCVCVVAGIGDEDHDGQSCVCALPGFGFKRNEEKVIRCSCVVYGYGDN